ncbi:MAG: energy transducer TonB [Nannocystaceae bacterium]
MIDASPIRAVAQAADPPAGGGADPALVCRSAERGLPRRTLLRLIICLTVLAPANQARAGFWRWDPPVAGRTAAKSNAATPQQPDGFSAPQLLNAVSITYPAELTATEHPPQGTVIVRYVVGIDGHPLELSVTQAVHPRIDALAIEAVRSLRYTPGAYEGQAVEVTLSIGLEIGPPTPLHPTTPSSATPDSPTPTPATPPAGPNPAHTSERAEAGTAVGDEAEISGRATLPVRISGVVRTAGDRTPVEGGTVLAIPADPDLALGRIKKRIYASLSPVWTIEADTDADGNFELRGVPDGRVRLIFMTQGYERLEYVVELRAGEALAVKYYQTPLSTNPYKTTVRIDRDEPVEVVRRKITAAEITNLPGTQGDALKSIQNFPGVARAPFGAGLLVVRGSAPDDSAIFLAGHEIPLLFHFGGLTSVFNSDILTEIDFIPGNFDSRYGDAIGGVVNIVPRKGRRDGFHGYIDGDVFDTGALIEGPIGKGSFILSGRRSYIDLLLPALIPDDVEDQLNFSVAPRYWDYQALFDYPLSGGDLTIRGFGSDDRLSLIFRDENEEETDERNEVSTVTTFHRADIAYRNRSGPWEFYISPSFRRDFNRFAAVDLVTFDATIDWMSLRSEISRRLSQRARWSVGTEFLAGWFSLSITAPQVPTDESTGADLEQTTRNANGTVIIPAVYSTLTWMPFRDFTVYPGVRLTHYSEPLRRAAVDPRIRFSWKIADQTTVNGGAGFYTQAPNPQELDPVFGNPHLSLERAAHISLGAARDFSQAVTIEATGFYRNLWDMVAPSNRLGLDADGALDPELYANTGLGRAYGLEVLARKHLTDNVFGWLSYTLMRSETKPNPQADFRLFPLDQTHILTLIGVYKLPHNWQFGARFRLTSGNVTTPVTNGILDANTGSFIPLKGETNSGRLPMFHQLDLRVDKKWVRRLMAVSLYLDIQNIYNRQNPEFSTQSFNFQETSSISGLPVIPSLGLKVEF